MVAKIRHTIHVKILKIEVAIIKTIYHFIVNMLLDCLFPKFNFITILFFLSSR